MSQGLAFVLSTSAKVGGAGLSLLGSIGEANELKFIAQQQDLAAASEKIKATEKANVIRQSLIEDLASQNALFASRGVGLNSGTAFSAFSQSSINAGRAIESVKNVGDIQAGQLRSQAKLSRRAARGKIAFGAARAGLSLLETASESIPSGAGAVGG